MNRHAVPIVSICAAIGIICLFLHAGKIAVILFLLAGFTMFFFRDPERKIMASKNQFVAPADGKIIAIDAIDDGKQKSTKICIFLSLFDVHINRAPVDGSIEKVEYYPGKFHAAYKDEASNNNEQNIITMSSNHGNITVSQIAGILARRIFFWKQLGDQVNTGDKIGMIAFGSRTELIIPGNIKLYIKIHDKVHAGSTVLGEWDEKN